MISESSAGPRRAPVAGVELVDLEQAALGALVGGEVQRPPRDRHLARLLRQHVAGLGRGAVEELVDGGERLARGGHLGVRLVREADVLGAADHASRVALAPDRQRRHAAGRRGGGAAVEVDVAPHGRGALGRAAEVGVHHGRPARVREHVDLRGAGRGLDRGDEAVEVGDRGVVGGAAGVVLVGEQPALREAVRGEPHRVGLELLRRPRGAVDEDHRRRLRLRRSGRRERRRHHQADEQRSA